MTEIWVGNLGRKFGMKIWDKNLGLNSETNIVLNLRLEPDTKLFIKLLRKLQKLFHDRCNKQAVSLHRDCVLVSDLNNLHGSQIILGFSSYHCAKYQHYAT